MFALLDLEGREVAYQGYHRVGMADDGSVTWPECKSGECVVGFIKNCDTGERTEITTPAWISYQVTPMISRI